MIGKGWKKLAKKHELDVTVVGPEALITFSFNYDERGQKLRTLFTQEMLSRGFLASASVYVSYAHEENHVKIYLKAVDEVFRIIKQAIESKSINKFLKGPIAHSGFKRLT